MPNTCRIACDLPLNSTGELGKYLTLLQLENTDIRELGISSKTSFQNLQILSLRDNPSLRSAPWIPDFIASRKSQKIAITDNPHLEIEFRNTGCNPTLQTLYLFNNALSGDAGFVAGCSSANPINLSGNKFSKCSTLLEDLAPGVIL